MYQPGGEFGKGYEAQIQSAKKTSVSGGLAHLAKTGLYNTTIGAGLGTAFEKTVGADARLKMQDMRMGRLAGTRTGKAGVLGSVGQSSYSAAKAGIATLTLVQAAELGRYGITANAICPIARTRMTEGAFADAMKAPDEGFDENDPAKKSFCLCVLFL